jgi:hypothetical protein
MIGITNLGMRGLNNLVGLMGESIKQNVLNLVICLPVLSISKKGSFGIIVENLSI